QEQRTHRQDKPKSVFTPPEAPAPRVISMADVKSERISWLWAFRIPFGKLSLLDGDPGCGKTTMLLDLAARLSNVKAMPEEENAHPAYRSLILSAEDGLSDTIKPRLEVAGADLSRID